MIRGRLVDLPPQPVIDREVGSCLPRVLSIGVEALRAGIDETARALHIAIWESQEKIRSRIPPPKRTSTSKSKGAIVVVGERVCDVVTASIKTKFQGVSSGDVAEVVIDLINLVNARLGTVAAESEHEEACQIHHREPGSRAAQLRGN